MIEAYDRGLLLIHSLLHLSQVLKIFDNSIRVFASNMNDSFVQSNSLSTSIENCPCLFFNANC